MSPRTATPAPTDRSMWRRLLMRAHPDQGGDGELFVWARELEERIAAGGITPESCGECCRLQQGSPQPRRSGPGPTQPPSSEHSGAADRLDFDPDSGATEHEVLVARALKIAAEAGEIYAGLLCLLEGCVSAPGYHGQERRGATYKQLALIAHRAGMSKAERLGWYEVAQAVPLSQRHAGYIIERLEEVAA